MTRRSAEEVVARMSESEKDYVALMVLRVLRRLHRLYCPMSPLPGSPQGESDDVAA